MTTVTIQVRGLAQAARRLDPARLDAVALGAMGESLQYVKGLVQERVPADRGLARASITAELRGRSLLGDLRGIVGHAPTVTYMGTLEEGRRAGARMPPVEAIRPWVVRHGMPAEAAFLVARAIGQHGLKAHRMFRDAAAFAVGPLGGIWHRWISQI